MHNWIELKYVRDKWPVSESLMIAFLRPVSKYTSVCSTSLNLTWYRNTLNRIPMTQNIVYRKKSLYIKDYQIEDHNR